VLLTAAHCVDGAQPGALVFSTHPNPVQNQGVADFHFASTFTIHPSYQPNQVGQVKENGFLTWPVPVLGADLALVKLTQRYTALKFPALDMNGAGATVEVVGYGVDGTNAGAGIKRMGKMSHVGDADAPIDLAGAYVVKGYLSLYPNAVGQTLCPGDSGGPAFEVSGTTRRITGVSASVYTPDGSAMCSAVSFAFSTRVATYHTWITETKGILAPPGGCAGGDDAAFSTLDGGCRDASTSLVWSKRTTSQKRDNAASYCSNLNEGGQTDWRLPTAAELHQLSTDGGATHLASVPAAQLWSSDSVTATTGKTVRLSNNGEIAKAITTKLYTYCVRP
jgi:hypothetical protein